MIKKIVLFIVLAAALAGCGHYGGYGYHGDPGYHGNHGHYGSGCRAGYSNWGRPRLLLVAWPYPHTPAHRPFRRDRTGAACRKQTRKPSPHGEAFAFKRELKIDDFTRSA
jgi:hypothetical protein